MKRLTSYEEIREALSEMDKESSSDEMDAVMEAVHEQIENPVASTLKNYMDAVYDVIDEQAPDWVDYIDFALYLSDIANEEEDYFQVYQPDSGYCVVYEDMDEDEEDDDDDEEEWDEDEEDDEEACCDECNCNGACG